MNKLVFILSTLLLFLSCKKNELGGKSTVQGTVVHHDTPIPFARVFIKFDAEEFPGRDTSLYDVRLETGADAAYSFKCYKGDYFLYGLGYDNAILEVVLGGIHVKVRNNERVNKDVPVTED